MPKTQIPFAFPSAEERKDWTYTDWLANEQKLREVKIAFRAAEITEAASTDATLTWDDLAYQLGREELPMVAYMAIGRGVLSVDDTARALADAWTMSDRPLDWIDGDEWLRLFATVGYLHDESPAPRPTEPVVLYRGSTSGRRRRWSWTDDLERAQWFARRLTTAGLRARVYTLTAPPSAMLAYFDLRDESEHVINTRGLTIKEHTHDR